MNDRVQSQVEELPENRVRLTVQVPSHDVHHAVEHAADDLAQSVKIPGFRKGKVPRQVLVQRVGRERLMTEAVESHIGGWFWNAAARSRVRPVEQPEYDFELPASDDQDWEFTATVAVQARPELPDWKELEVGAAEIEVPEELVQQELDALRATVAELVPVEGERGDHAECPQADDHAGEPAGVGVAVGRAVRTSIVAINVIDLFLSLALWGANTTVRIAG